MYVRTYVRSYLSIYPSIHPSIYLSIYLFVHACMYVCMYVYKNEPYDMGVAELKINNNILEKKETSYSCGECIGNKSFPHNCEPSKLLFDTLLNYTRPRLSHPSG